MGKGYRIVEGRGQDGGGGLTRQIVLGRLPEQAGQPPADPSCLSARSS